MKKIIITKKEEETYKQIGIILDKLNKEKTKLCPFCKSMYK